MATQLVPLPEIERLSPRVIRILGGNPGKFTLQGTNTYLLGTGPSRILLDTGEGKPTWSRALSTLLASERATITTCLLTHWHHDHILGVPSLLSHCPSALIHKHNPALHGDPASWSPIAHAQRFTADGVSLRAVHCPGHTTDHMAFVLEEEDAMFTGDNVLGHGTAVFEDLAAYMRSLEVMAGEFGGRAYPGHGAVVEDGRGKVREYIEHRKERERQVVEVMEGKGVEGGAGKGEEGRWTAMEIVKIVYKDVPENLHIPAEGGVAQVLRKLERDGKVAVDGEKRWRLSGTSSL